MRTAGSPNFVSTSRSASVDRGRSRAGNVPTHLRADPPTALCGQPGSYGSGVRASVPFWRRKSVTTPAWVRRVSAFRKTPPRGTFGRLGSSDQSTVAQPESG